MGPPTLIWHGTRREKTFWETEVGYKFPHRICSAQSYELLSKIAEHLGSFYFMDLSY